MITMDDGNDGGDFTLSFDESHSTQANIKVVGVGGGGGNAVNRMIAAKVGRLLAPNYLRSCARRTKYSSAKIQEELGWKPDPDHETHFRTPGRYGDPHA